MSGAPTALELEQLWTELAKHQQPGRPGRQTRRLIPESRFDCFLAVEFPLRTRLLSVATDDAAFRGPDRRALTSGILIAHGSSPLSRQSTVDIVLRDEDHSDIFTALAADLLSALASADVGSTAIGLLLARLEDWQRLLAEIRPEGMSPEYQRGLFGELVVLEELLMPAIGPNAVRGWTGPDRQLQDFQFPTAAIEVKTVSGNSAAVIRVANERQLDNSRPGRLFLVTLALDVRQGGPGLTLPELVTRLRGAVGMQGVAGEFGQRLAQAGYLETQSHLYNDRRYTIRQILVHLVSDGFPKITERDLADGVSDVSYTLNLLAAAAFRTTEDEMTSNLDQLA